MLTGAIRRKSKGNICPLHSVNLARLEYTARRISQDEQTSCTDLSQRHTEADMERMGDQFSLLDIPRFICSHESMLNNLSILAFLESLSTFWYCRAHSHALLNIIHDILDMLNAYRYPDHFWCHTKIDLLMW